MSRHEGVSCDSCLKGNFRGRRYKCLICYDYDLCETCYDSGTASTSHTTEHPMQCILTRTDYELYYGGEPVNIIDIPQAFTCPYCYTMGFTDTLLQEHVTNEHADSSYEVICPVCAAMPGGDPNVMTDDLAGHLTLEHRSGSRDLISFLDEPVAARTHTVRRMPHTGRGTAGARSRRSNMFFSSSGGLTSLSATRDAVDPIAELLPQLSSDIRHSSTSPGISATTSQRSHLQHLQRQLQLEHSQVARQQLERLPRPQLQTAVTGGTTQTNPSNQNNITTVACTIPGIKIGSNVIKRQFLLDGVFAAEKTKSAVMDEGKAQRSFFVQDLLSSITKEDIAIAKFASLFPKEPDDASGYSGKDKKSCVSDLEDKTRKIDQKTEVCESRHDVKGDETRRTQTNQKTDDNAGCKPL